jgi:hypothetical protein
MFLAALTTRAFLEITKSFLKLHVKFPSSYRSTDFPELHRNLLENGKQALGAIQKGS